MSQGNPTKVIHAPGKLILNPTDNTNTTDAGGTELGLVADAIFRPNLLRRDLTAEEYGSEVFEIIEAGEQAILSCLLRGWDADAVATVFKETSTGTNSGDTGVEYPGSLRAGTLGTDRAVKILYLPDASDEIPAIYLYNAIPLVQEAAELALAMNTEQVIAVFFQAIRDSSNRVYTIQKLEDITL
jgi:hypothetical protein